MGLELSCILFILSILKVEYEKNYFRYILNIVNIVASYLTTTLVDRIAS